MQKEMNINTEHPMKNDVETQIKSKIKQWIDAINKACPHIVIELLVVMALMAIICLSACVTWTA